MAHESDIDLVEAILDHLDRIANAPKAVSGKPNTRKRLPQNPHGYWLRKDH